LSPQSLTPRMKNFIHKLLIKPSKFCLPHYILNWGLWSIL